MLFVSGWDRNLISFDGKGKSWLFGFCLYDDDGMKKSSNYYKNIATN
jgi:hypothetical protein